MKDGLYDSETLAAYLLYRLNSLNSIRKYSYFFSAFLFMADGLTSP
jgi:hypothetical protein